MPCSVFGYLKKALELFIYVRMMPFFDIVGLLGCYDDS